MHVNSDVSVPMRARMPAQAMTYDGDPALEEQTCEIDVGLPLAQLLACRLWGALCWDRAAITLLCRIDSPL